MNKIFRKTAPFIALAGGILFIVLGFISIKKHKNFTAATATITRIERVEGVGADDSDDYNVFVSYKVNGKEYESKLGEYSASMSEGKKIDIKYNPEDPGNIISASNLSTVIYLVFGTVAVIAGVVLILKRIFR